MLRLLVFAGTRPEAVKLLPVVVEADRRGVACRFVATGQHADLLAPVAAAFARRPDATLPLARSDGALPALHGAILAAAATEVARTAPDIVVVQGDTVSALACAEAGFYAGVPVAHVEAGLRSGSLAAPHPEEGARRAIDALATHLLAPSEEARGNLAREGRDDAVVTGNPGIDALFAIRGRAAAVAVTPAHGRRLVLATAHRRESHGRGIAGIAAALTRLAARGDVEIVLPVHPSPAVAGPLRAALGGVCGVRLVDPLGYVETVALIERAELVLTDSGGLQEEAPALGRPVLVLRDVTERPEVVAAGAAQLVGTDPDRIVAAASRLLDDPAAHAAMARPVFPYGAGGAAGRILDALGA